ncbi:MAG: type II toxin-antitoxin system VapC family toxin [Candidatus Poribacteria bacterium]|nr:type II toxin-antitoxin system VapC family toxin [Candidatus Poribacteria bacterium]
MGQRILIETTVIIRYLRTPRRLNTALAKALATYHQCFLSTIMVYEVEFGAARAGRTSDLSTVLPYVEVLEIDQRSAEQAAQLHSLLISRNQDIGIKDVFIAATCLVHTLPILTYNMDHFSRVPGLQVIPPS